MDSQLVAGTNTNVANVPCRLRGYTVTVNGASGDGGGVFFRDNLDKTVGAVTLANGTVRDTHPEGVANPAAAFAPHTTYVALPEPISMPNGLTVTFTGAGMSCKVLFDKLPLGQQP